MYDMFKTIKIKIKFILEYVMISEKLVILLRLLKTAYCQGFWCLIRTPSPGCGLQRNSFAKATGFNAGCGAVGSVSGLGPEGRQFEPGHPDK
jgi:hypothetical protein